MNRITHNPTFQLAAGAILGLIMAVACVAMWAAICAGVAWVIGGAQ